MPEITNNEDADALAIQMRATKILRNVKVHHKKVGEAEYWYITANGPEDAAQHVNLNSTEGLETFLRVLPERHKKLAMGGQS